MSLPFYAYSGKKPFIFISYAHKDKKEVYQDILRLYKEGYLIWYDEGIEVGTSWPEAIGTALLQCDLFLIFITPNAMASVNVRNEINLALDEKKDFSIVYIENTILPPGIRLRMGSKQSLLKYNLSVSDYWIKLQRSLSPKLKEITTNKLSTINNHKPDTRSMIPDKSTKRQSSNRC